MTDGVLLDTHMLLWLQLKMPVDSETLVKITEARSSQRLFLSDISIWEIGVAAHKKSFERTGPAGPYSAAVVRQNNRRFRDSAVENLFADRS